MKQNIKDLKHSDPLPPKMRKKAIEFAKRVTGIQRPVKEHRPIVTAWEDGYLSCKELVQNSFGGNNEEE